MPKVLSFMKSSFASFFRSLITSLRNLELSLRRGMHLTFAHKRSSAVELKLRCCCWKAMLGCRWSTRFISLLLGLAFSVSRLQIVESLSSRTTTYKYLKAVPCTGTYSPGGVYSEYLRSLRLKKDFEVNEGFVVADREEVKFIFIDRKTSRECTFICSKLNFRKLYNPLLTVASVLSCTI